MVSTLESGSSVPGPGQRRCVKSLYYYYLLVNSGPAKRARENERGTREVTSFIAPSRMSVNGLIYSESVFLPRRILVN